MGVPLLQPMRMQTKQNRHHPVHSHTARAPLHEENLMQELQSHICYYLQEPTIHRPDICSDLEIGLQGTSGTQTMPATKRAQQTLFHDMIISVLEFIKKTPRSEEVVSIRNRVERNWTHLFHSLAPRGLNMENPKEYRRNGHHTQESSHNHHPQMDFDICGLQPSKQNLKKVYINHCICPSQSRQSTLRRGCKKFVTCMFLNNLVIPSRSLQHIHLNVFTQSLWVIFINHPGSCALEQDLPQMLHI